MILAKFQPNRTIGPTAMAKKPNFCQNNFRFGTVLELDQLPGCRLPGFRYSPGSGHPFLATPFWLPRARQAWSCDPAVRKARQIQK